MNKRLLFFIILMEGFLTIGIEIISIRQMVPFVGSNVLNTSIIIGIFLLFLSFGYYRGGMISGDFRRILLANLTKTFIFISFGLSFMFLSILFSFIEGLAGLIVFSLGIMAPTVYFLGQTIPILTNLVKNERNGKISGELLFVSTFGSFLGSIITSVVFLNFLGVNNTIIILVGLLSSLLLALSYGDKKQFQQSLMIVAILFPISFMINSYTTFIKTNNYSNINVADINNTRHMFINNSASSSYNPITGLSDYKYIKSIQKYILTIDTNRSKDILVMGAGGFTLSLGDNLNKYDYIDIDKDLLKVAEENLLHNKINGKFIVSDGRQYLIKNKKKYNIIIVDMYSNKFSIPSAFVTTEFYRDVAKSMDKDGVLFINTISKPMFKDAFSSNLNHSILQHFDCEVIPVEDNLNNTQNILYACSVKQNDDIYTDDKTNLFTLIAPSHI